MPQSEYFVIERENNDDHPLLAWDQKSGKFGLGAPVPIDAPILLRLREPLSPSFQWVDYHSLPDPVVSEKISQALIQKEIYGVQIVPALVRNPKEMGDAPKPYHLLHIWMQLDCIDKNQSELDIDEDDGQIWDIEKLVLDKEKLEAIDVEKRLLFELAEKPAVYIAHHSIVQLIKETQAVGIRFFPVEEWNSDIAFS